MKDALFLRRALPKNEKPLNEYPRIRWLGSDGGVRIGWLICPVGTSTDYVLAYDDHRREIVMVDDFHYEPPQRDVNGNVVDSGDVCDDPTEVFGG